MANKRRHVRNILWASFAIVCWVARGALIPRQGWDPSYGPVVPHDRFPTDCRRCHSGSDWHTMKADFQFDHKKETGVDLRGAHATTSCLLCHNDRGPTQQFAAQGCSGCHQDPHRVPELPPERPQLTMPIASNAPASPEPDHGLLSRRPL